MAGPGTPLVGEATIWSARTMHHFDQLSVYLAAFSNRNYEGEVTVGGTVKVFKVSDVAVTDYAGGWTDADWESLGQTEATMQIDQQKKVLVKVPDVRQEFNVLNLIDQGANRIAYQQAQTVDAFIASKSALIAAGNAYGTTGTPITVGLGTGEVKPSAYLARIRQKLVDAKAPISDPRIVVPTWFHTMLVLEMGNRQTAFGDSVKQGAMALAPGYVGEMSGLKIFTSTAVPNAAGKYTVMCGDNRITFAMAMDQMETIRLQNDFATGIKGLMVYGATLLQGAEMAVGVIAEGAYA